MLEPVQNSQFDNSLSNASQCDRFTLMRHYFFLASFFVLLLTSLPVWAAQITVFKAKRILEYKADGVTRTFKIGLGSSPTGRKLRQGDRKTPEGSYVITHKNPQSQFYLSLGISYPNLDDAALGRKAGVISAAQYAAIEAAIRQGRTPSQHTPMGGDVFIHGKGAGSDWTWGCIALDDKQMRVLYDLVRPGDKISIRP
ncbi:L,D-transpeptidase family protein [Massilia sp. CCM 9210]|uniref:L,D-transpeptidase family protein n=1 Tax=Massilia scottii TaxID=3057166 RepID=UPI002796792B|nr:L,D-transpeptidase family protein [Massilia sp. CCM 9210]MDQ1814865.1 L,D-transpeptidase family protein [Massilia sp. CCM 9210]